jgi:hypothetical protein
MHGVEEWLEIPQHQKNAGRKLREENLMKVNKSKEVRMRCAEI